jgi:hypothetical protein
MRRAILTLAIAAAAAVLSFRGIYEPDLGWHLAHGREDVGGHLVRTNVFSFNYPEYRQHYTSWLFDTAAYLSASLGGDAAVQALQAALLAAAFAMVYLACRVRSARLPSAAVVALGFAVLEPRAIPRPHLVSFVGLAACAWVIEQSIRTRSPKPLWWGIPLAALWANAHSEAVFGAAAIGLFATTELVQPASLSRGGALRALVIAVLATAALLATPYGVGLFRYLIENSSLPQLLAIAEVRPAYWPAYGGFFVYLAVAAAVLGASFFVRDEPSTAPSLWEAAALVGFGALGWRYLRLTPLVFLVTAPMVAARLTCWTARVDGRAMLITAVALAAAVSRVPLRAYATELAVGGLHPPQVFSSKAVEFVRAQDLSGPVFNSNNLGGWIEWTMYPRVRTFQDSRLQAYPPDHFRGILAASRSPESWNALVAAVDWAVLSLARPSALSGAGRFPAAEWATVFWDEAVEVRVRRGGRYSDLAARRAYQILLPDAELFEVAPLVASGDVARLRDEATRNRSENPDGFLAASVMCLLRDQSACADAERLGARWAALDDDLALLRALRGNDTRK